jgi:hypothetical protein
LPCAPRQRRERERKRETGRIAKVIEVMKKTTSCRFQTSSFLPVFLPCLAESGDDLCVSWRLCVVFMERGLSNAATTIVLRRKRRKRMMLELYLNELCLVFKYRPHQLCPEIKYPITSSVRTLHMYPYPALSGH